MFSYTTNIWNATSRTTWTKVVCGFLSVLGLALQHSLAAGADQSSPKVNVLFIISDDLTSTAVVLWQSSLPNTQYRFACRTGDSFHTRYCQGTYCGPSRASFMSGYYPHATGVLDYTNPRPAIGDRATWSQHFLQHGYYAARVSKIFHMGVPIGIEEGSDGADDPDSWVERFNSQGPEWRAAGEGETLEGNPDGKKPVVGGNTFVVVEADGDDLVHSDGRTAAKAVELIAEHRHEPFFIAVGFVRPHVPFVAPKPYFEPFLPYDRLPLPEKVLGDWDDIPPAGINYKTSKNMQMDERRQRKAIGGYYASVAYMDAQVGKLLNALKENDLEGNTIVIFTSDHGYHLGEHDFWAKVSLHEESAKVPLIVKVPGKSPAVCESLTELLDLYPTTASLCGLEVPSRLQGKDISAMLDDPKYVVRNTAFSVSAQAGGFLLRDDRWAYIQYAEDASEGIELFDMQTDPLQLTNLAEHPAHKTRVAGFQQQLEEKLSEVRHNDLDRQ
ncbi:MAG: sulfatase [Pirellulaceae bacterium]